MKLKDVEIVVMNDEEYGEHLNQLFEKVKEGEINESEPHKIVIRKFNEKYKMNFDEFKQKNMVEQLDHSFDAEEDYCDWELALDGIESINTELKKITKKL